MSIFFINVFTGNNICVVPQLIQCNIRKQRKIVHSIFSSEDILFFLINHSAVVYSLNVYEKKLMEVIISILEMSQ